MQKIFALFCGVRVYFLHNVYATSMKDKPKQAHRTTIVLDPKVKEQGEKLAKKERRSLSKFIEQLICDAWRSSPRVPVSRAPHTA